MKIYRLYCEGAFDHQRKMGSIAYSIVENNEVLIREAMSELSVSANLMEMHSVMSALEEVTAMGANKQDMVMIYTDFKPVCDAFEKGWIHKWMENGWINSDKKPVKHKEAWEALWHLSEQLRLEFVHEKRESINMLRKLKKQARKALRVT